MFVRSIARYHVVVWFYMVSARDLDCYLRSQKGKELADSREVNLLYCFGLVHCRKVSHRVKCWVLLCRYEVTVYLVRL